MIMDEDMAYEARRITWIGLSINVFLSGAKLVIGTLAHSQAVVADGVHSLSDLATDITVLFGVKYWSAPPDEKHPYGHRRIETVITTFIGSVLALVALGIGYDAVASVRAPHVVAPGWMALGISLVCIVSKEILYRWTVVVGSRIKSTAVIANAWHHRSDALSSIPVAVAVAIAFVFPSWTFVDHLGAMVVCVFILHAAWVIVKPTLGELVDEGVSAERRRELESLALAVPGVKAVHAIRTRKAGSGIMVDLHVKVDGELSVRVGHDISEAVKRALRQELPDVLDVVSHLEPYNGDKTK